MSNEPPKGDAYANGYGWTLYGWHNHHLIVTFNPADQAADQRRLAHEAANRDNPNMAGHNFYREWLERAGEIER